MRAFFPEDEVNSVYDFPFERLTARGIRGIIFDIDNTLVPPDAAVDARCRELIRSLKTAGFRICLVSNNKAARIAPFATALNLPFVERALKPRRYGYRRAMARMGTTPAETIAIGDQLFTDIWGANRAGMHSLLVKPMEPKEEIQILLKRFLERPVLWLYRRKKQGEEQADD